MKKGPRPPPLSGCKQPRSQAETSEEVARKALNLILLGVKGDPIELLGNMCGNKNFRDVVAVTRVRTLDKPSPHLDTWAALY